MQPNPKIQQCLQACADWGLIPTEFKQCMTWEEQVLWLFKFINSTIIPALNTDIENVETLATEFAELETYVDEYFDNLDVQQEINNKLDQMAESGELEQYFARYVTPQLNALNEKVDSNNATINAKVDNYNTITNDRIDNLVESGVTPLTASSTDEMTDQSRIYVNTTDGHWYYWNGTAWTDGGTYQSAVDPTGVSELIMNQIQENLKGIISFAIGSVNQTTGAFLPASEGYKTNISTANIQQFSYDLVIPHNDYVRYDLFFFNADGTFNRWQVVANNLRSFKIPAGQKWRMRLWYNNAPSPAPDLTQDDMEDALLYQNALIMPLSIYREKQFAKLESEGYAYDPENLKNDIDIQIGDCGAAGLNLAIDNNKRLVTTNVLHYDFDVVIPKTTAFQVYLWNYTDASGSGASAGGWLPLTTGDYILSAGRFFRLLFVTSSASTTPLLDFYDNASFKAFKLYKKTDENVVKQYNTNCRSVAHQGYNPTAGETGHCMVAAYELAKQHGFDYGECDIKFTSDGVPVCSHDASFVDDGTTVVIADHTYAELVEYSYYGGTISSFEEVVATCKKLGMGLYIDHLNANWSDAYWNTIFGIVKKYQMLDNSYWLLNAASMASRILTSYNKAKIVLLADSYANFLTAITNANSIKTDLNTVTIDFNYQAVTTSDLADAYNSAACGIQFECWTIDNTTTYKDYLPLVSGITSNKVCYNDIYSDLLS